MDSESVQSRTLINESWGQTGDWLGAGLTRLINDQCPRAEILAYRDTPRVKTDNYTHSFLLTCEERESCCKIYYWIGRYLCIIFSLLFPRQDIFEESFVWKSNLGLMNKSLKFIHKLYKPVSSLWRNHHLILAFKFPLTVSIVQWWWGFRMRSQRLWTANTNMRIIESRPKCDKNESSWTFNLRLVSANGF